MASHPDGITDLFDHLDGPYRVPTPPVKVGGSLKINIDKRIRKHAGLELDSDHDEVPVYYFPEEGKMVVDLEGVGDE